MRTRLASSTAFAVALTSLIGVVLLTTGPLYRVRTWWSFDEPLETDAFVVAVQAVVAVVGVAALATGDRWRRVEPVAGALAAALAVWLVVSVAWSLDAPTTLRHSLLVAGALAGGAAVAAVLPPLAVIAVLWVGVHLALAWSAVAIRLVRPRSLDANGDWAGIFVSRNSLALYAALGVLTSVLLAWSAIRNRWSSVVVLVVLALAGGAIAADAVLLAGTDSLTPLVALALSVVAVAMSLGGRVLVRRGAPMGPIVIVAGVTAVAAAVAGWVVREPIVELAGRDPGGSGRAALWEVSWEWFTRRPLVGQGFMGPWSDDAFLADVLEERGELLYSAHSSFVDVLLGGGVIGGLLIVALVARTYWNVATNALTGDRPEHLMPLALLVFILVEHTTETLFVAGQLLVALVGALLVTSSPSRAPDSARRARPRARPGHVDGVPPSEPLVAADRATLDR